MHTYELVAPCHFGLEAVLKREIQDLGYDILQVEDGKITFAGDNDAICRANIFLRTAERVLLKVGKFHAETFDELFEGIRALPWEVYLPKDGKFWVAKASSVKSKLFSPSDIQRIVKKAVVEKMKEYYDIEWFKETGVSYPIRIFLMKDEVLVTLDTSGDSLHKRGYRTMAGAAPLSETLAAALIKLTPWNGSRVFVDPFCGSGTFAIEAAMMAANMAPGTNRDFIAQEWENITPRKLWYKAVDEAQELANTAVETDIQGYDIDGKVLKAARENAKRAGVEHLIHFQQRSIEQLHHPKKYGFLITNPPYGERMAEEDLPALYRQIGEAYARLDSWSMYLITGYEDAQRDIGLKADKNRKIYNGMLKTYFYQFMGPKPPKRGQKVHIPAAK